MRRRIAWVLVFSLMLSMIAPASLTAFAEPAISFRFSVGDPQHQSVSKMTEGSQQQYILEVVSGSFAGVNTPSVAWSVSNSAVMDFKTGQDSYADSVEKNWKPGATQEEISRCLKTSVRAKTPGTVTLTADFKSNGISVKKTEVQVTVEEMYALSVNGKLGEASISKNERRTVNVTNGNVNNIVSVSYTIEKTDVIRFVNDAGLIDGKTKEVPRNIDIKGMAAGESDLTAVVKYQQGGSEKTLNRKIHIKVTEGGSGDKFRFVDEGQTVNERTIRPNQSTVLNVEKNGQVEDPASYTLEIVDFGQGEAPIYFPDGQNKKYSLTISGWPQDRHVTIAAGESNGDATVKVSAFKAGGQKIGEGTVRIHVQPEEEKNLPYTGPVNMFYDTDLDIEMEGWNASLQQKYGDPFTAVVEGQGDDAVVNIVMNLTDEAWRDVFNNADISDDINVRLSYPIPQGNLKGYMLATSNLFDESLIRTILSHHYMNFSEGKLNVKAGFKIGQIVYSGGKTVINAVDLEENTLMGVYYTKVDPKELYTWQDKGNVRLTRFRFTQRYGERSITTVEEGGLRAEWLSFNTGSALTIAELTGVEYKNKKITYYFDGDRMIAAGESSFAGVSMVTELSIPGVQAVTVTPLQEKLPGATVDTTNPGNVKFSMPILISSNCFGNGRTNSYQVNYKVGGKDYTDVLFLNLKFDFEMPLHRYIGFSPVDASRVSMDATLTDGANRGFEVAYVKNGEIASSWTGSNVDIEGLNPVFYVSPPEGKTVVSVQQGYANPETTVAGAEEVVRINLINGVTPEPYTGPVPFILEYIPEEHELEGCSFYSTHHPQYGDEEVFEIIWHCEGGEQIKEFLFYSMEKNSFENLPADKHRESGNPEPELVSVTDGDGNPVDITGFELETGYYAKGKKTGNRDFDYYTINLVDPNGNYFTMNGNEVKLRFSYPEGVTAENASAYGFELNHYQDEFYSGKVSEELEIKSDGVYVTLTHFSPFLLTWEKKETPVPSDDGGGTTVVVVVKPDKAVTPVTVAADGKQMMGGSVISLVPGKFTAAEKAAYVEKGSWSKDAYGYWSLKNEKGVTYKNCWVLVSDKLGGKSVGNASWYYLDANGRMLTGWHWIAGADGKKRCYYFNKEDGSLYGACLLGGTTPDNYPLNEKGEWIGADGKAVTK